MTIIRMYRHDGEYQTLSVWGCVGMWVGGWVAWVDVDAVCTHECRMFLGWGMMSMILVFHFWSLLGPNWLTICVCGRRGGGNLCECIWGETSECGGVGVVWWYSGPGDVREYLFLFTRLVHHNKTVMNMHLCVTTRTVAILADYH